MKFITFPKQYYVGMRPNMASESDALRLGFATPVSDDAAFQKRKDTVDTWAKGSYYYNSKEPREEPKFLTFDNVPTFGFSVETSVSRSYNDNKMMQVNDPRGFRLEISIANFTDLLLNSVVDHGVFDRELVWGRDGNINRLYFGDDPEYLESLKDKDNYVPQPGDFIETQNATGIYIGTFYVSKLMIIDHAEDSERSRYSYYGHKRDERHTLIYDPKPYIVIDEKYDDETAKRMWNGYRIIRKWPKKLIVREKGWGTVRETPMNTLDPDSGYIFSNTLEEQKAFTLDHNQIYSHYRMKFDERQKTDPYYSRQLDTYLKYPVHGEKVLNNRNL